MASIQWIKITTDIFDDEKILLIESMPEADAIIVIWFKLLTLAGRQNMNGLLMMTDRIHYTEEMLATIFRRNLNTVRLALNVFEQFGMIEIINDIITIPNWEKHQSADKMEKVKEQTRLRVAKHREKQKQLVGNVTGNVTVTQSNATDIDIEIDTERDKDKEYKEVVEEGKSSREFIDTVANNLGRGLVHFEFEMMNDYLINRKVSQELFLEAVKIAVANNVRKFNYICRILDNWIDQGVQTAEQAYQAQMDFKAKKPKARSAPENNRKSNVPDWATEEYRTEATPEELDRLEALKKRMMGEE